MRKTNLAVLLAALFAACAFSTNASAQQNTNATVVSSCGTPPSTYVAGKPYPITQDTTGTLCSAGGGGGGGNVNLTGINGVAPAVGNGTTNTGTQRVTLSSDGTGQVKVVGPTANGSPAANPPVLVGGTADATATGTVQNAKVDLSGNIYNKDTLVETAVGTPGDTACVTDNGSCSIPALVKRTNQNLTTLNTTAGGAVAAGTNLIGKVGVDQTTPGTTNNVTVSTNVGTLPLVQATASAAISIASGTTTQIIAASGSTVIRIMQLTFVADAANTVTYESADTGGACANPVALSGAEAYAANGGESDNGLTFVLPSGKAFCILTTAAGHGHTAYAQF